MEILIDDSRVTLIVNIVLHTMTAGVAHNGKDQRCPVLSLEYSAKDIPVAVHVAKELVKQGGQPEVFIKNDKKERPYVAVIFKITTIKEDFLKKIIPEAYDKMLEDRLSEVFMTGEADFEINGLDIFMSAVERQKKFTVLIVDDPELTGNTLWSYELSSFTKGLPCPVD